MRINNMLTSAVKKLLQIFSVASLTLLALSPLSPAYAYDTDIYFSAEEGNPANHANVVFILDNSGSMRATDGTSTSRMDKLKSAMTTVLDGATDVNIGLVIFAQRNGLPDSELHKPLALPLAQISSINDAGARDSLKSTINGLEANRATPLVDALFEASMMMTGGTVRNSEGGTMVVRTDTVTNPATGELETIDVYGPTPLVTYPDPMQGECQPNHIILLSDGGANGNNAADLIQDLTGASCSTGGDQACGVELASWLQNTNHSPGFSTAKNITVHTVGFLTSNTFLPSLSTAGGGNHYGAEDGEELVDAFQRILTSVKDSDASIVAPATSIDQSSRLSQSQDLFFALFKPQPNATWNGNLKKYKLGVQNNSVVVLDASNNVALDSSTGEFASSSREIWSGVNDGNNVELGGAASKLNASRNLFTHIGPFSGQQITTRLSSLSAAQLGVESNLRTKLLDWINGTDVKDEDDDENRTELRYHLGDIIHSTPVSLNYSSGKSTIFVGTNEGFLHAFDLGSGEEDFAFIPEELVGNLGKFYNSVGAYLRPFGLDGEISIHHIDNNNNSIVDGADKAYLYVGMRRGGKNYYALDVTSANNPRLMWKIEGGSGDFARLGQTWSRPTPTQIYYKGAPKQVVIFGGGYDINQDPVDRRNPDSRSSTDSTGNSVFIVDAETGSLLWSADQHLSPSGMNYGIPADLRIIDINGDNHADRIYVGDMGGQVWRFDIKGYHQSGDSPFGLVKGGIMAKLGSAGNPKRFYNEPDVALMSHEGDRFMSISIGSGWRADPTHTGTQNRFYMIRDNNPLVTPAGYGKQSGNVWNPITDSDLPNVTNSVAGSSAMPDTDGWMLDLVDSGEKNLSRSTTINKQVVFSSYTPIAAPDPCSPPSGRSQIYAVNALNGDPALALSGSGSGVGTAPSDRRTGLGTQNIPPAPSGAIVQVGGQIYTGVIAGTETPLNNLPFSDLTKRTYWQDLRRGSMTPTNCRSDAARNAVCR